MSTVPAGRQSLARIRYGAGGFATLRRAMLDDLPGWLPDWRESPGAPDHATAVVELWAYVGDVLSLYQELYGNEAFLPTATRPESLRRLAELVGYRPAPGAAATALLAFTVTGDSPVTVPAGLRVSSKPAAGLPTAVFQTDQALAARAEHSAMPLAVVAAVDQFAPLPAALGPEPASPPTDVPQELPPPDAPVRTVLLRGTALRLPPGVHLLVVDDPGSSGGQLRQLVEAAEDRAAGTTSVRWRESPHRYASSDPAVHALRATAAPFGHDAPPYASLPDALTEPGPDGEPARYPTDWDVGPAALLPDTSEARVLHLDRSYPRIAAGTESAPAFVVLVDTSLPERPYEVFRIRSVEEATYSQFALTARVTRLTLDHDIPAGRFLRRDTTVLLDNERLALDDRWPLPVTAGGTELTLRGLQPDLARGRTVVVAGPVSTTEPGPNGATTAELAEPAVLADVRLDQAAGTTTVRLQGALRHDFVRAGTVVLGNVVRASHGDPVREEILGSGNGTAWQEFRLRKGPLTFVPPGAGVTTDPAPEQADGSAVRAALTVLVDGVLWREADVATAEPGAPVYELRVDDGSTVVRFGDTTARPPTGRDNVRARYRVGLGSAGDRDAGTLVQLVDSVPGLRSVTNPLPTTGAADPEQPEEIRGAVPASVRTVDRAVSLADHALLARTFPGVGFATAAQVTRGPAGPLPRPEIHVVVAGADRRALGSDTTHRVRAFLDARRDVNVPLRVVDVVPVPVEVSVLVEVDERYGRQATRALARAALLGAAAAGEATAPDAAPLFAGLRFGEPVHLSTVYSVVQRVPGVRHATVTRLRRPAVDPLSAVLDTVPVPATGLAVPAPDAGVADGGVRVEVSGGGFAD